MSNNYITKFSLSCLTVNCIIIKIFIDFMMLLVNDSGSGAVTALWLSAAIGILILLAVYKFRRQITAVLTRKSTFKAFCCLVFAYFVCLDIYFLYKIINTVHATIYHNMPLLLILIIMIISMLYIGTRGVYSIMRLHSICVPVIVLGIIAVAMSGLKYTNALNAVPMLGSGLASVFSSSLKHLFAFSEITIPVLTIILSPKQNSKTNGKFPTVILVSSIIGILIYSAVLTVFFTTMPVSAYTGAEQPLYYLSKVSAAGRLNARTDALYALVLTASSVLFIGSTFNIIIAAFKKIGFTKKFSGKYAAGILIIAAASLVLCSCYDAREVENTAYIIAVGADLSSESDKQFSFTLQFSNPLSTGQNTNTDANTKAESSEKSDEESGGSDGNTTVDNIRIEANNFFEALNKVTNHIGKAPSLAHIKLLVISEDIAFAKQSGQSELTEGICSDLMSADEIRPETSVCIAKGLTASEYLTSVKPSLEESTARHYELMFNKNSTFDSTQTDLRSFTMRLGDDSADAYAPLVTKEGFDGTVLFSGGSAAAVIDSENSRLMNIILGNVRKYDLFYTDKNGENYMIKQSSNPKIRTDISNGRSEINSSINISIYAEPVNKNGSVNKNELSSELNEKITKLIDFIYSKNSDVFEIGKSAKAGLLYEHEWESIKQYVSVSSYNIKTEININAR